MIPYVVWDWNGTLLNDVDVAMAVMDRMLSRRGLPSLGGAERYREIFTFPVREYYLSAGLDLVREPFEELAVEWTQLYGELSPRCVLFPGAEGVLRELEERGVVQMIASASPQETLERQVEAQGVRERFQVLLGLSDIYADSKAGLARRYFQDNGIDPAQVIFVGDTLHDWEVAKDAGCGCVLLAQGHQSQRLLSQAGVPVLESIRQVPDFLKALGKS
jgi:phosphoglycolate phosphatase